MKQMREFRLEVILANGGHLETTFSQLLQDQQMPAPRFYLGYSSDSATTQDLPWIAVGNIAYLPDDVVAVKIVPLEEASGEQKTLRAV